MNNLCTKESLVIVGFFSFVWGISSAVFGAVFWLLATALSIDLNPWIVILGSGVGGMIFGACFGLFFKYLWDK